MVTYFRMRSLTVLLVLACGACGVEELGQSSRVIQARFDPGEGAIPMPSDLLEDDKTGKLDIPLDDADLTGTAILSRPGSPCDSSGITWPRWCATRPWRRR